MCLILVIPLVHIVNAVCLMYIALIQIIFSCPGFAVLFPCIPFGLSDCIREVF